MYFSTDDNPYECPMANYIDSGPGAYGPSTYKTNCKNGNLQIQKLNKNVQNQVKKTFQISIFCLISKNCVPA